MLTKKTLVKGLSHPDLLFVLLRRWFPWSAFLRDPECAHLVKAWSSGCIPRKRIPDIFPGLYIDALRVRKPESRVIGWSLDIQELVHLISIAKFTNAKRILEIGTFDGFTALNIASNLPDDAEICTVDLPPDLDEAAFRAVGISNAVDHSRIGVMFRGEPEEMRIRQCWGDSTKADWKSFGSPFDLILIDGCHEYTFVKSDSLNALKNISPGGTILWHDYGYAPDVSRAVDELAASHPVNGIIGTRFACLRTAAA